MGANDNDQRPDLATLDTAADWVDRLDELTAADRATLTDWLRGSPVHAAAFASLRRTLRDTALLEAADRVLQGATAPAGLDRRSGSWSRPGLIAASLAILAAGSALILGVSNLTRQAPPLELATAIGTRADYDLSDRSVIHLNADSRASVAYARTRRDVRLHQGDAVFDVAKNARRPFNVLAGNATVTAVGTSFEVDMVGDAVEVRVFEGAVQVSRANAEPRRIGRGEWLLLASNDRMSAGRFEPATYQDWRSDWLDAESMPLKYVVARLNRYSVDKVVLSNAAIGELRVTGRFKLNRTAEALAMISALMEVDAVRQGSRIDLSPRRDDAKAARRL